METLYPASRTMVWGGGNVNKELMTKQVELSDVCERSRLKWTTAGRGRREGRSQRESGCGEVFYQK